MEQIIIYLSESFEQTVSYLWLPLLIWTGISAVIWSILKSVDSIHPQYQYHARLALLISLPAGFLFLGGLQGIESFILSYQATDTGLRVISVTSPIEISISSSAGDSNIKFLQVLYAGIVFLFIAGVFYSTLRFVSQWLRLNQLRQNCGYTEVNEIQNLNRKNRELLLSIKKDVKITFISTDIIPVTFGFRNPVILLPDAIRNQDENLNLALRHELSHITQNDFLSQMMASFTQALFWFHPLVHLLKKEIIEFRELRCDMLVLAEKSVSRKRYASLLLELLPKPNVQQELTVNMAQESSNLKKRIQMITQHKPNLNIPKRSSLVIFGAILTSTIIMMACTDMQTQQILDEEDLNLMTEIDRTGDRGYHQIIIFLGDEEQHARHSDKLSQLELLKPDNIHSIELLHNEAAIEAFGARGENGVMVIKTNIDPKSYNTTLKALGMEPQTLPPPPRPDEPLTKEEDYFVVVEQMPELIGGLESIMKEIRYPEMARRAGIEGRVYVQFIVNEQGNVENAQILRGIGGGADEEALRVVRQAKFKPGLQRGQPVRVQYALPIFFRLNNGNSDAETASEPTSMKPGENMLNSMTVTSYGGSIGSRTNIEPEVIHKQMKNDIERHSNSIRGKVYDHITGEPPGGANIYIPGTDIAAAANINGEFILNGISDQNGFIVSFVGYQKTEVTM